MTRTPEAIADEARLLRELSKSAQWSLVLKAMSAWQQMAITQLSDPQIQNDNSIQFLRGALWATQQFPHMLTNLINEREVEHSIALSKMPAMAGKE